MARTMDVDGRGQTSVTQTRAEVVVASTHNRADEVVALALSLSWSVRDAKPVPSQRSAMMSFSFSFVGGSVNGSSMSLRMMSLTAVFETALPLGRSTEGGLMLERALRVRGHTYLRGASARRTQTPPVPLSLFLGREAQSWQWQTPGIPGRHHW